MLEVQKGGRSQVVARNVSGVVKSFNQKEGHGIITLTNPYKGRREAKVRYRDLGSEFRRQGEMYLLPGWRLAFDLELVDDTALKAVNVRTLPSPIATCEGNRTTGRERGTVKLFSMKSGTGYVTREKNGLDIFFNLNSSVRLGEEIKSREGRITGLRVEFDVIGFEIGESAVNLEVVT
jgi:cold shock CspA family protein